jgi:hypothetical protein
MSVLPPKTDIGQPRCRLRRHRLCYGGAKLTDKHLAAEKSIVANQFLETDLEKLRVAVSTGLCAREIV